MSSRAIAKVSLALLIVVIVVIAGIGTGLYYSMQPSTPAAMTTAGSSTAAPRDTLTIDETFWPGYDLNPIPCIINLIGSDWWLYTVYQSLVTLNGSLLYQGSGAQMLPMLATDWTASPDGMTYTLNLKQNVTFSNGDPFNAYQVWGDWYGFYYLTGNSSAFMSGYNVFDFSKASFGPATLALMAKSGVVNPTPDLLKIMMDNTWPIYVTGPYQIVLHLKAPFNWMVQVLSVYSGLVLDTQYILQNGGFGSVGSPNTYFNSHAIPGTGPYMLDSFQIGSYAKFTQNPTYWGKNLTPAEIQANPYIDPGHVKNVIVNAKSDDLARYADLSTGTVQIASILTQNWRLVTANPDKYSYFKLPDNALIVEGIGMNVMRYPTNITAFRLAIVHGINVTDINQRVFFGTLVPMVGPEYRGFKDWYDLGNLPPYQYNLTLAKQYLQQSGVDVSKLQPLEFRVMAGCTTCEATAEAVQGQLSGSLGIPVTVEVTPPSSFAFPQVAGIGAYQQSIQFAQTEAQFTWMGFPTYAPNEPTPADAWIFWANYNSPACDYANYANPVVQKCVDAWFSMNDVNAIRQVCTAAYAQYYNDAPYLWLGNPTLAFGGGSVVWQNSVVKSFLMDPTFTGESTTAIFNTVTFVNGQ